MKKLFLFYTILFWNFILSQNNFYGIVDYSTEYNLGLPVNSNSVLYFNSINSVYVQGDYIPLKNDETKLIEIENSKKNIEKIFTDLKLKELHLLKFIDENTYLVFDKAKMVWTLTDETKKIFSFNCQKATGNFRGRNYIAWFTNDIPVSTGPWKLNGLPGLIVEVTDDQELIKFYATKITLYKDETNLKKDTFNFEEIKAQKIILKDYLILEKEKEKEMIKILMSKFPQGSMISEFKEDDGKSNIELKYEWEENK